MRFQLSSLAMVAGALSRKYGVRVRSSGDDAFTVPDKNGGYVINIPAVAVDDPEYVGMIRGFIDHETAHCRFTDWDVWKKCTDLGDFYKAVGNIFEDGFIERRISGSFIGCKHNLERLATLMFDTKFEKAEPADSPEHTLARIARYILYVVRGESNGNIAKHIPQRREELEEVLPGLAAELDPLLAEAADIDSTSDTLDLTRRVKQLLQKYMQDYPQEQGQGQGDGVADALNGGDTDTSEYGTDVSQQVQDAINDNSDWKQAMRDATEGDHGLQACDADAPGQWNDLSEEHAGEALRAAAALDAQLNALLQHKTLNREGYARRGRLDKHRLYRLAVNDPRIFTRRVERVKTNTEVVVLTDASGSMYGDKAKTTSMAMYALAAALRKLKGVRSAVYAFGGHKFVKVLGFDRMLTRIGMSMDPDGGTPAGYGLHNALQQFTPDDSVRKICIVMTDGAIDERELWDMNLKLARKHGVEVVGVGIEDDYIRQILPEQDCKVIKSVHELAPALFSIMRRRLVNA